MITRERFCDIAVVFLELCASIVALPCVAEEGPPPDSLVLKLIERAPIMDGELYKCADMAFVVNELRKVGKAEAIRALRELVARTQLGEHKSRRDSVFLICRCLFDKPDGWTPPRLGRKNPDVPESAVQKLPVFPLAYSNDLPFMVIGGYLLGGQGEDPMDCLKLCGSLSLRTSDLPTYGYEMAARALVSSPIFVELYPEVLTRNEMAEMVLRQATSMRRDSVER